MVSLWIFKRIFQVKKKQNVLPITRRFCNLQTKVQVVSSFALPQQFKLFLVLFFLNNSK